MVIVIVIVVAAVLAGHQAFGPWLSALALLLLAAAALVAGAAWGRQRQLARLHESRLQHQMLCQMVDDERSVAELGELTGIAQLDRHGLSGLPALAGSQLGLDQQHDLVRCRYLHLMRISLAGETQLATGDGLDAGILGKPREFHCAEQVAGIGHGHCRHGIALAEIDQLLVLDRPFREGIGGMNTQMDKIGMRHGVIGF